MMNTYYKFAPSAWVMKTTESYGKGVIAQITNKYGKETSVEIFKLVASKDGNNYYSFVRLGENYAQRKINKHNTSAELHESKSNAYYEASKEGKDFLALAEPIKIGHHSEHRHRALIERNNKRIENCVKESDIAEEERMKAKNWEKKAKDIDLSMPESLDYYKIKLEDAKAYHNGLKNKTIPPEHSFSVQYANKAVKDLTEKVKIANKLWGE